MAVLTQEDIDSYKESARFFAWCQKAEERRKSGASRLETYLDDLTDQRAAILAAEKLEEMARELRADADAIGRYREKARAEDEKVYMKRGLARKLLATSEMTQEEIADCLELPLSEVQDVASESKS